MEAAAAAEKQRLEEEMSSAKAAAAKASAQASERQTSLSKELADLREVEERLHRQLRSEQGRTAELEEAKAGLEADVRTPAKGCRLLQWMEGTRMMRLEAESGGEYSCRCMGFRQLLSCIDLSLT